MPRSSLGLLMQKDLNAKIVLGERGVEYACLAKDIYWLGSGRGGDKEDVFPPQKEDLAVGALYGRVCQHEVYVLVEPLEDSCIDLSALCLYFDPLVQVHLQEAERVEHGSRGASGKFCYWGCVRRLWTEVSGFMGGVCSPL
ncbi:Mod5 protein-sorting protein [Encephalitozoon hellem ATCC 50504]|uniref:Mod5 protein-sorting protein n=1 Tax=Encephalitozoon hellem (strain ATCC 50504) TaxID=907965 RepID=UPI000269D869|nr:Mod5 protein-sorting protein [Encephalitozoon hellem ATCC 50504]AFM99101.1 Mod5 protein-sorting protein [Encephalitozoon hellem ATCC 50504]|eukprot:XP_003888082.1 Mod5 protein-sorting protein [Encephalitozoon hellem ATCC 50504]